MKHPVDVYIGEKLTKIRKKREYSQEVLSQELDLSRQLIQKYESGDTRVPVSVLYDISKILNIEFSYFTDGLNSIENGKVANNDAIPPKRMRPLNILLVEDSLPDGMLTRRAIDECEHDVNVFSVDDGVEALTLLRKQNAISDSPRPDIILLDLNIPKKPGLEVLKEIKNDRDQCDIPIIVVTNSMSIEEMKKAYRLGASGFIVKSFYPEEFFEKISHIINYWANVALPSM